MIVKKNLNLKSFAEQTAPGVKWRPPIVPQNLLKHSSRAEKKRNLKMDFMWREGMNPQIAFRY